MYLSTKETIAGLKCVTLSQNDFRMCTGFEEDQKFMYVNIYGYSIKMCSH